MQEGTSNYFKGLMLILCYLIVAASFFVHEDINTEGKSSRKLAHYYSSCYWGCIYEKLKLGSFTKSSSSLGLCL